MLSNKVLLLIAITNFNYSGSVNDQSDDVVDDVIDSLMLPANTVGESPLESQGIHIYLSRLYVMIQ